MQQRRRREEQGYALAALLVTVSVMMVLLGAALPVWRTLTQREREAELVFRGEQYARAIAMYQRQYANTPPPDLDTLVDQKFLRRRYTDPMSADGEFVALTAADVASIEAARGGGGNLDDLANQVGAVPGETGGVGGIVGVTSSSQRESFRDYYGGTRYNEWLFLASQFSQEAGLPAGEDGQPGGVPGGEAGQVGPGQRGAGTPQPVVPGRGRGGRRGVPVPGGF